MQRYGQFCPIAIACEVFAERWTPLVLRDLMCGKHRFNELHRGLPLMSRTLLSQRLRDLEAAGLVTRVPNSNGHSFEYHLTHAGKALKPVIMQLGEWGRRWMYPHVSKEDLDPALLMWDIHQRIDKDAIPEHRVVVQFDYSGIPQGTKGPTRWWLVLEQPEVDLCMKDPGYELDLLVTADLLAMTKVWMGEQDFSEAQLKGLIKLQGSSTLARAFPGWLKLSVFAHREPGQHSDISLLRPMSN